MRDTYLKSVDALALEELRSFVINMIGPVQGSAATLEATDSEGTILPARPAKGNPDYFYVCIRAPFPIAPYGEIEACDTQDGIDVCGVWA